MAESKEVDMSINPSGDIGDSHSSIRVGTVSKDVDVAETYADQFHGEQAYSRKEEVRLRWKLDLRLVRLLWFNVTLGAMDKFLWGCILIATGFANDFATLIALRVLLGALEAPIVPGNLLVLGMWYTRKEQPIRTGLMYTGLSVCFTGPIGWGIGFIAGDGAWRSMFWITGAMTIVWACIIGLFLPDNPVESKFVTERQKAMAIERLRADQTGIENKTFKKEQMIEAFVDPKTWLMFLFNIWISIPNGGLTNFAPLIIKGLGYTSQRSVLLTMPTGIMQTCSSYMHNGGVFLCAKHLPGRQLRTAWILFGIAVGLVSSVFLYALPLDHYHGRLAALYVSYFYLGPYILSLGLNTANTAGHTKKVTVNALLFVAYCISNIVAPLFFKPDQAPLYPLGMGAILASYVLSVITICLYAAYCARENRTRDRVVDGAKGATVRPDTDFKDLTDMRNPHFRYIW